MSLGLLHDGRACADAAASSRALHYGDGVFRTLLWHRQRAVDWDLHMNKLAADCRALALDLPDAASLADEVAQAAGAAREAVVKIIVARRSAGRGYRPAGTAAERWVIAGAAPAPDAQAYRRGIVLDLSDVVAAEQPLLAGLKHLNRLEQVLASRNWPDGIDERLLCDAAGRLVGGTRSNLFCVVDGRVCTPRLDRCGVAGIMRRKILDCCATMGLRADEVDLPVADLTHADEVFVCNALIGIWPVRAYAQRTWAAPGAVTRRLMQALQHPWVSAAAD